MIETVLKVEGMACGMCESHVNDTIRGKFPVKRVTSSHSRGETVILSESALDEQSLRDAIAASVLLVAGLLWFFKHKKWL